MKTKHYTAIGHIDGCDEALVHFKAINPSRAVRAASAAIRRDFKAKRSDEVVLVAVFPGKLDNLMV